MQVAVPTPGEAPVPAPATVVAWAVQPVIAVLPSRNPTDPATPVVLLSAAPTVAVKVSNAPSATLGELAPSAVVVAVCGGAATVTMTAGEVEEA